MAADSKPLSGRGPTRVSQTILLVEGSGDCQPGLIVACVEGALALLFFMHLWENRGLKWFILIFTVAVILGMLYGWSDSFPPTLGSIGMISVVYSKRNQDSRTHDSDESVQDW
jgi:hypothetical protein